MYIYILSATQLTFLQLSAWLFPFLESSASFKSLLIFAFTKWELLLGRSSLLILFLSNIVNILKS